MEFSKQKKALSLLWAGIVLILIIIAGLAVNPGEASIRVVENETSIVFLASRRWVVNEGDCVIITWELEGTKSLAVDGQGHSGRGDEELCVDNDFATTKLEVEHIDGTSSKYVLSIGTMANAPEIWILSLIIMTLFLSSIYIILQPFLERIQPIINQVGHWSMILGINLLIALVIGEIGLRFYILNYGTEEAKGRFIYSLDQLRERSTLDAMPFLNYVINSSEANNLGYRGTEDTVIPKPDGIYRIVALGGSTTYGLGMSPNNTYPAQLEHVLQEDYGYEQVEVLNAGAVGYTSWNSVANLAFRVLEVEPDLIIIYHGVNDVGSRLSDPECYRGENIHRGINIGAGVLQMNGQFVSPSTLHRFIGINLGLMEDPLVLDNNIEPVIHCEESMLDRMELVQINEPVYLERNLITMIGIAQAHDIDVMLSTWTYNREIPENVGPDWWKVGVEGNNAVIREVALRENTFFFDLNADSMSDNPDYWFGDFTHQSEQGTLYQARLYAEYLTANDVISSANGE